MYIVYFAISLTVSVMIHYLFEHRSKIIQSKICKDKKNIVSLSNIYKYSGFFLILFTVFAEMIIIFSEGFDNNLLFFLCIFLPIMFVAILTLMYGHFWKIIVFEYTIKYVNIIYRVEEYDLSDLKLRIRNNKYILYFGNKKVLTMYSSTTNNIDVLLTKVEILNNIINNNNGEIG